MVPTFYLRSQYIQADPAFISVDTATIRNCNCKTNNRKTKADYKGWKKKKELRPVNTNWRPLPKNTG